MPRSATYEDVIPRSDKVIEAGQKLSHGAGSESLLGGVDRSDKAAPLSEGVSETKDRRWYSGMGSRGFPDLGSGKGRHLQKTLGAKKGLGAKKTAEKAEVAPVTPRVKRAS